MDINSWHKPLVEHSLFHVSLFSHSPYIFLLRGLPCMGLFHSCLRWCLGILFLPFSLHDIFQVSQMFLPKFICVSTFMCNQPFSVLLSSVSEGYNLLKYHTMFCNAEVPQFQRNSLPLLTSLLQCYHFKSTWHHIQADCNLYSACCQNLISLLCFGFSYDLNSELYFHDLQS